MIPFGPWHPDKAGLNTPVCREAVGCLPGVAGYKPFQSLAAASTALTENCLGAGTAVDSSGGVHSFAGTATKLWKLTAASAWDDVTRTSGGPYAVAGGERWRFATFGDLVLATAITDAAQKYLLNSSADFAALGGSPPRARYIAVVRDFVLLGGILNTERRVVWSGINNAEFWTAGSQSSDFQDFPDGGPVRGLLGGEVGYVFQANKITRMTFAPGSEGIFQFDPIEDGPGLMAPDSLVRWGQRAFYLGPDGFYQFDTGTGASQAIGVGKWAKFMQADIKGGFEGLVIGGIDPYRRLVCWAYVPSDSINSSLTRVIGYDWSIDEATIIADGVPVEAFSQWLTQGVTLDTMNSFGNMETLPYSLDSAFWRGGKPTLGVFGADKKLSYYAGQTAAARWVTADGEEAERQIITGTRPAIDGTGTTVAISMRERDGDPIGFDMAEALEDTGVCPAFISGNLARADVRMPAGAAWSLAKGITTYHEPEGSR